MKKIKITLAIALLLNILFIGAGSYVVKKNGGIDFVKTRMQAVPPPKKDANYYFTKKSVFENSLVEQPDKVFIGDSITDYGEFQEYFPDEVVLNRGIRNDVSKGVLDRIEEVVSRNPNEAYLMIGVNDIRYATDIQDFEENITAIVNAFDEKSTKLFILSILPVNNRLLGNEVFNGTIKEFNDVLQRIANENRLKYIDLHAYFEDRNGQLDQRLTIDGLHLNGEGYKLWIDTLSQLK